MSNVIIEIWILRTEFSVCEYIFTSLDFPSNWLRTSCGKRLFVFTAFLTASSPPIMILSEDKWFSSLVSLNLFSFSFFFSFLAYFSSLGLRDPCLSSFLSFSLSSFADFSLPATSFSSLFFEWRISLGAGQGGSGGSFNLDAIGDDEWAGDASRFLSWCSSTTILGLFSHLKNIVSYFYHILIYFYLIYILVTFLILSLRLLNVFLHEAGEMQRSISSTIHNFSKIVIWQF